MSALDRIGEYFSNLAPETLAQLGEHYAPDVHFLDPINEGRGLADLQAIFEDLFKQLKNVKITVVARSGDQEQGFLRWTMDYTFRGKSRTLPGTSHFTFDTNGKVASQHDFWDAGFGVYAEFPMLGAALRGIRKMVRVRPRS